LNIFEKKNDKEKLYFPPTLLSMDVSSPRTPSCPETPSAWPSDGPHGGVLADHHVPHVRLQVHPKGPPEGQS